MITLRPHEKLLYRATPRRAAAGRRTRRPAGQALRHAGRVFAAEALKQHRRSFGSKLVVFSMLIWPVMQLAATYYTVRPLAATPGIAERWPLAADPGLLLAFLATGTLGFTFFFSLVQSAWHFSFERVTGTLELLFLSPADRLVIVVANGFGALVQNAWLFTCFMIAAFTVLDVVHVAHPAMYAVVFLALLVPAIAWGAFLNSVLIFSRDSAFLYTLLDDPMWFAAGVRLPLFALPGWIRAAGSVLPLTGSLVVVRGALLSGQTAGELAPELAALAGLSALLFAAAVLALRLGEANAQRTGRLRLF
ncbi:multidrug ABC transporter permease [Sphaerisporangium rufum]|uniref:Multidrug ABC transporter permease n=1 Tax=Sphaerisporangium rufum TaxID=1381558 RepID=A0A919UYK2_9ACTN|nr:ABC transporter permease [Sphaerisporangium rufum]GII75192.1 multidrug ABC transporter permease [Sphaerisporangium rufum]